MKQSSSEGITEEQVAIIRRWRGVIMQVAVQEMVHMCLACNLLTAVGGTPHVRRPNMPSSPRAYGPGFSLELTPFNRETMATFVFIEHPEAQETEFTQGKIPAYPRYPLAISATYSQVSGATRPLGIYIVGLKTAYGI